MKIVVLDGYTESPGGLSWDALKALDELFARSGVPGLQMPLFPFSTGITNRENIARMKDGVITPHMPWGAKARLDGAPVNVVNK